MNIEQEVQSAMPALMERIKAEAITRIERQAVEEATAVALKAARDWATENLVPEIRAQLEAGKGGMVVAAQKAAEGIADAIGDALIKRATESLSQSWNVRSVAEAIFK